jgi:hypothetical protein
MKVPVYLWAKRGEETFGSCRAPSEEYARRLRENGWTIFKATANLPEWLEVADTEARLTMDRNLTPGSMPAVNGGMK